MRQEIVMIQPNTSLTGSFVRMLPIGLLYASSKVIKYGYKIHLQDTRIRPSSWENDVANMINDRTIIVGFTVMSGVSVKESIKISRYIKRNDLIYL